MRMKKNEFRYKKDIVAKIKTHRGEKENKQRIKCSTKAKLWTLDPRS